MKDGEWVQPRPRGYLLGCCDCGLVHRVDFRIATGLRNGRLTRVIQFRAFRAERITQQVRGRRRVP